MANPTAGVYTIRVHGISVTQQSPGGSSGPNPRQDFAVAVANATSLQPNDAVAVNAPESATVTT